MSEKIIDFLARKKAKEERANSELRGRALAGNEDPEKFIKMMMSKVSEKLGEKEKNYLTIITNMMEIEKLASSPSTDATEEEQVKGYTKDECTIHLLESNYLDWDKNAAFYKAVARRFRALSHLENE
jgi:hypothetical protein